MCAAIANYNNSATGYTSQYGNWNRTRRLQVPPYVATENNVSRTQTRLAAADALILNMNEVDGLINPVLRPVAATEANKKDDTLFGPGVGIIPSGPGWAGTSSSKDEISPDVIKSWLIKSKDTSVPTTTLQALVNLKRPSIKLSPLAAAATAADSNDATTHAQHGLEFEFDCDAPKCSIKMFALGLGENTNKLLLFEALVDGGFGRVLKYDEGAILELVHLESGHDDSRSASRSQTAPPTESSRPVETVDPLNGVANGSSAELAPQAATRSRKRFSHFTFRKRSGAVQQVTGPALPVVDADATTPNANATETNGSNTSADPSQPKEEKEEEKGIRVVIEIEALDQDGVALNSPNSQLTYLHIVRMGTSPSEEDDKRPWMVKVVKREAKIGTHLFHLHEIYGLSSATSPTQLPTTEHTYPPTEQAGDEQTSECLLCLSSPREVVLLPCRHLVACRECAVNMVEFGAGGTLVHTEADAPVAPATNAAPAAGEQPATASGANDANGATGSTAPPVTTTAHPPRRKRKAKGWFCPVCRQPYTSLLRITATPPEKEGLISASNEDNSNETSEGTAPAPPEPTAGGLDVRSFFPRPNFLRSLSRPGSRPSTANASNMV